MATKEEIIDGVIEDVKDVAIEIVKETTKRGIKTIFAEWKQQIKETATIKRENVKLINQFLKLQILYLERKLSE